jgi:hypothetical protein
MSHENRPVKWRGTKQRLILGAVSPCFCSGRERNDRSYITISMSTRDDSSRIVCAGFMCHKIYTLLAHTKEVNSIK